MKDSEIKIGTPVIYWRVIRKDGSKEEPFETEISSPLWKIGRKKRYTTSLCMVKGIKLGVPINKLEKIDR